MKLFIAGTDTGVGKTWVSTALAQRVLETGKSVTYYKPIQTGAVEGSTAEDPEFVSNALQGRIKTYCTYCFTPPVAPYVADSKGLIDINRIVRNSEEYENQTDLLLIEGAGGLAVPLTKSALVIDLIKKLNTSVLLVSRSQLGTINHTLLSVEALLLRNILVAGIVFNFYPDNPDKSELAVKTLLYTVKQYLPEDIPIWHSMHIESKSFLMESFKTDINIERLFCKV